MPRKHPWRWLILTLLLLAVILIPFAMFGDRIEGWAQDFIETATHHPLTTAGVLGGLLSSDILLPIPSSIVSTACGKLLGFGIGTLTSFAGMTLSCILGFLLGKGAGGKAGSRLVGEGELERLEGLHQRFGAWIIVITRPIPVLAEAAVFLAGMGHMETRQFLIMSSLSNLGVSLAYAAIGAWAAEMNSFLVAFAAAMLLPGIAMLLAKRYIIAPPLNQ